MKLPMFLLLGAFFVAGAVHAALPNEPVERIDLERYLGTWHEVARMPNRYQEDCVSGTTATYLRDDDGEIVVRNACTTAEGERMSVDGVAREVVSGSGNLQVRAVTPELDEVPAHTSSEGDVVITRREMSGVKAPPFWQAAMRGNGLDPEQTVDRWQRCRFVPPSSVLIDVGVALAGQGGFDAPPEAKTSGIVVDLITPETETSIWYFWGLARNFRPDDKALTASIREAQGKVFMEDLEMLESQQRNLLARPERKLLSLNTDLGGVQARRIIDRWLAAEQPQQAQQAEANA